MESFSAISAIIKQLAWPLVVVIVLIIFRQPLSTLLVRASRLRLKAGGFEIETSMQGYVSETAITQIKNEQPLLSIGPTTAHVIVLSVGIKGFTSMNEGDDVETYAHCAQEYLKAVTKSVFELGGSVGQIDDFSITAFWGAPLTWDNPEERACLASLLIKNEVATLNKDLSDINHPPLKLRMGIYGGTAMVGNFGVGKRFNFGVVGDVVSISRRLENLTLNYESEILMSDELASSLGDHFMLRLLGEVNVKGRSSPLRIKSLEGLSENIKLGELISLANQVQPTSFVGR